MMQIQIDAPATGDDIRREIRSVAEQTASYWSSLDPATFFAPIGDAWSPAENVRHLVQSNRPVTVGLGMPKLVLLLRFGPGLRGSRTYDQIVDVYRAALSGGLRASGRYLPRPADAGAGEASRDQLVAKNRQALDGIDQALARWGERSLDRICVRHPGLGKMTVREILFFTLYHNAHHAESVASKLDSRRRSGLLEGELSGRELESLPRVS